MKKQGKGEKDLLPIDLSIINSEDLGTFSCRHEVGSKIALTSWTVIKQFKSSVTIFFPKSSSLLNHYIKKTNK